MADVGARREPSPTFTPDTDAAVIENAAAAAAVAAVPRADERAAIGVDDDNNNNNNENNNNNNNNNSNNNNSNNENNNENNMNNENINDVDNDDDNDNDDSRGGFECNICLDSPTEPVVTPCGHLYCWSCLRKWLQRADLLACPVCKAGVTREQVIPLFARGGGGGGKRRTAPTSSSSPSSSSPPSSSSSSSSSLRRRRAAAAMRDVRERTDEDDERIEAERERRAAGDAVGVDDVDADDADDPRPRAHRPDAQRNPNARAHAGAFGFDGFHPFGGGALPGVYAGNIGGVQFHAGFGLLPGLFGLGFHMMGGGGGGAVGAAAANAPQYVDEQGRPREPTAAELRNEQLSRVFMQVASFVILLLWLSQFFY